MSEIVVELNSESIGNAIAKLEQIKNRMAFSPERVLMRLLEIGIKAAKESAGKYKDYISFYPTVGREGDGFVGLLIASDMSKIISRWKRGGDIVEAEVSPLLMAEFGSGWYANVAPIWSDLVGQVGQGTFPGQTHAFDPDGWEWEDENGIRHQSQGEMALQPMYNAWQEMASAIEGVTIEAMGIV